jgi:flagellar hook-length control protein FliK
MSNTATPVTQAAAVLPVQPAKGSSKEDPAKLFGSALNSQLSARQAANSAQTASAASTAPPVANSQANDASDKAPEPSCSQHDQQTSIGKEASEAPAQQSTTRADKPKDKEQEATADDAGADGQSSPLAALAAQLQNAGAAQAAGAKVDPQLQAAETVAALQAYVSRGLDAAQAAAEAAGGKLAKTSGLARTLLGEQKDSHKLSAADEAKRTQKALETDLTAVRSGETAAIAEDGKNADTKIAAQVDNKLQDLASLPRQITVTPLPIRTETPQAAPANREANRLASTIFQPVGGDGWDSALGHRVVMMVSNQQQEVELQLNPPHLGPLDVKLSLNQDQASLSFVAATAPVRDALEASLPRLQEMLAESGIQLAQTNVQARTSDGGQQGGADSGKSRSGRSADGSKQMDDGTVAAAKRVRVMTGLPGNVNLFV